LKVKVFITGATGFVGTHLRRILPSAQYEVFGTSYPEVPQEGQGESGEKIFYLDMRSEKDVRDSLKSIKPDWIFHLAAVSNVRLSWEKRKETLETNLMGTFFLLEAVRQFVPQARVLFVSSSDVYGVLIPEEKALGERDALHVVSPYTFTKITGEMLSEFYSRIEKVDAVIARSFSHTGPGQSPDFVCSDWASQIARIEGGLLEPVIRVGNGNIKRDFTDVRDVVRAYLLLVEKGRSGEIYNVCSGKAVKLKDILDLLLSLSEEKIAVEVDEQRLRKVDIPLLLGDNKKIREETAWQPEVPLRQTLSDLLNYWRQRVVRVRPS
jgi:GDP-4-dehydro-6-deoxy-D-mannose reductase